MRPEPVTTPPSARLYELTTGAWVSQAISVAADLGVADELVSGPLPVDEIAEAVGADAPTLYRLLRALADVDVFQELDGRRFALAPVGHLLRSDVPGSMRGWAIMLGRPFHLKAWADLLESVRTGEPAFDRVHGQLGFDYFRDHPEDARVLDEAMTAASGQFIAPLVEAYDFGSFGTVVDVGGGHGALLAAVLSANPRVRGVLFDLPHVIATAGGPLKDAGVSERCELVGGDFFDSVPAGGDAYLLSNIIHDWDDEHAERILVNCRAALRDGGCVLLAEGVLPSEPGPSPIKWMDLEMLIMASGRQRTADEYRRLFERVGLRMSRVVPTDGMFSLVEAVPA